MENLEKLLRPASVAIIGASEEKNKIGHILAKNLLELGYAGEVFLVNPKHENLLEKRCYKSVLEIEKEVDLAIVAIPGKLVLEVIREASFKMKNFVVISAGFSEIGEEGKKREAELLQVAKESRLNILGPNCLGFINPELKLNASFAGGMPVAGNISFITQSGALAVGIMDAAQKKDLRFSNIISVGNKMQLGEVELLEYLEKDARTKVIGMYLEGVRNGSKFIEIARRISQKKPIVILKAGKTERTQKAISSHTGALAGRDEVVKAVFKKTGIIRANDVDEFLSLLNLSSLNQPPENKEVIVVTNAGGLGILTTDAFKGRSLELAEISPQTQKKLRKILPEESSVTNPIDILGDADEKRYSQTLKAIKKEKADSFICLLTPQYQTPVKKIAQKIIKFKESFFEEKKRIITVFMGEKKVEKAIEKLKEKNISNYFLAEQAVNVLDKYYQWGRHLAIQSKSEEENFFEVDAGRKNKISALIGKIQKEKRKALLFSEAVSVMKGYDIETVEFYAPDIKEISFPAVVKVDSSEVLHKTDKKGLILGIKDVAGLEGAVEEIRNNFPGEGIIVQPLLTGGTELILGIKKDETFGPILVFGLGGIYAEVFKAVDFIIPLASKEEIRKILLEGPAGFLFRKTRGQIACDLEEIVQILFNLQLLALENPEIKELDINPLLSFGQGKKSVAVDVKIII